MRQYHSHGLRHARHIGADVYGICAYDQNRDKKQKPARVVPFHIAGKTGTAQEAKPEGGYSEFFIHNLVGFGPAENPRFTILVKLDKPKGVETVAVSLADTFGDIVRFLINYYGIPPIQ